MSVRNERGATVEADGSIPVTRQDSTSDDISVYLAQFITTATVIAPAPALNDEAVAIETGGVAPVAGNFLCLKSGTRFLQAEIHSVTPIAGNQYTLGITMPIDFAFPIGSTCELQNVDMNVNGSVTPVDFRVGPANLDIGTAWDITRIIPTMVLTTAGDDGKFGNLTELSAQQGLTFRVQDGATGTKNLFNARTNGDFADEGFDVAYPIRSGGGGDFGMRARITFNGDDKRGVVKRLRNVSLSESGEINGRVRADLTLLGRFRVKVQGHVVEE